MAYVGKLVSEECAMALWGLVGDEAVAAVVGMIKKSACGLLVYIERLYRDFDGLKKGSQWGRGK